MCGIVGLAAFGKLSQAQERKRQEAMIFLGTELLRLTEIRGKDATGIAALRSDGDFMGLKMGVASGEFISRFGGKETDFGGFTKLWREGKPVKIMLGHCRKSSVGSTDNVNNHPIKVGEIVGIHNGTLKNHEIIIEMLGNKRDGEVDSEAIFRLINHFTNKSAEPFTPEVILEVCRRLEGQYACLAFNGNNPYQLASFRDGRPMEYAYIRPLQLLVIASEKGFFEDAFCIFNREVNIYGNKKKLPHLSFEDVDFRSLPNDNLNIFDLTQHVDEHTKLEDLLDFTRIPFNDKIWTNALMTRPKSKAVNKVNTADDNNATVAQNKTAAPTIGKTIYSDNAAAGKKTSSGKQGVPVGRIWVKEMKKYRVVDAKELEEAASLGRIELSADEVSKDVVTVKNEKQMLQEAANIEDMVVDPAKIEEIPFKSAENNSGAENGMPTVQEVDMTVDPDAIEQATDALAKMPRFSDDNDLANTLNIASAEDLARIPLYGIGNRIKKIAFRLGFMECARRMKNKTMKASPNEASIDISKAQKHIRVLKVMHALMSKIVNRKLSPATSEFHEEIDLAVKDSLSKSKELTTEAFKSLFTEGDLRANPALRQVKRSLRSREKN